MTNPFNINNQQAQQQGEISSFEAAMQQQQMKQPTVPMGVPMGAPMGIPNGVAVAEPSVTNETATEDSKDEEAVIESVVAETTDITKEDDVADIAKEEVNEITNEKEEDITKDKVIDLADEEVKEEKEVKSKAKSKTKAKTKAKSETKDGSKYVKAIDKMKKKLKEGEVGFVIDRNVLVEAVSQIERSVEKLTTLESNKCVYILFKDNQLELRAANSHWHIRRIIKNNDEQSVFASTANFFEICVFGQQFISAIKNLKAEDLVFQFDKHILKGQSGRVKFSVPLFADPSMFQDFEEVKNEQTFEFDGILLSYLYNSVAHAVSNSESRPALTGINHRMKGNKLVATATDSHRLSRCVIDIEESKAVEDLSITVPVKTTLEVVKLINDKDTIQVTLTDRFIQYRFNDITINSVLIEGKYPDTERLIPNSHLTTIDLRVSKLREALQLANIFINKEDKNNFITLQAVPDKNQVRIKTHTESSFQQDMFAEEGEGELISINFNLKFLQDVLKKYNPEDVLAFNFLGDLKPFTVYLKAGSMEDLDLLLPIRPMDKTKFEGFKDFELQEQFTAFSFDFNEFE